MLSLSIHFAKLENTLLPSLLLQVLFVITPILLSLRLLPILCLLPLPD